MNSSYSRSGFCMLRDWDRTALVPIDEIPFSRFGVKSEILTIKVGFGVELGKEKENFIELLKREK